MTAHDVELLAELARAYRVLWLWFSKGQEPSDERHRAYQAAMVYLPENLRRAVLEPPVWRTED